MASPLRVGLALDIHLLFKNHTVIFAEVQRFADEAGWLTVIDDWAEGKLVAAARGQAKYDGVIARVDSRRMQLVKAAATAGVPLVNVLASSPAVDRLQAFFRTSSRSERSKLNTSCLTGYGISPASPWKAAPMTIGWCLASKQRLRPPATP